MSLLKDKKVILDNPFKIKNMIDSSLKNANILIVDDQEANIDVLEGFLEMQSYTNIKTTTDPREVVQLFASFQPDLILLDLTMPYLTGFEVMAQLKTLVATDTYLPILVLTADATTETKQRALSGGAHDFLTKPFNLIEVGLRIRNLLLTCYLHQQLKNQNQILEEKVKERTFELENKNIELNIAKEKAEASDKLKTAFLQTISHEVRTPLNGILGFGSILAELELFPEEKQEYVNLMRVSSDRLVNTITNYVDISLIVSGNVDLNHTNVHVIELMNDLKNDFSELCEAKNLSFELLLPDDLKEFTIYTDLALLRKIVSHLLDNAIKFTKEGCISIGFSIKPSNIEFFIKDTGIGIEKDAQERIFEYFMQENVSTTRVFEGNGLGLSITKGFLKILDGDIRLESIKDKGTTFFFSLPITTGDTK